MPTISIERWERSAATGAIVAVVMMAIAVALTFDVAAGDAGDLNRRAAETMVASGVLVSVAGGLFLWWFAAVRARLERAAGAPTGLASLAAYGGIVWLILTLAATAVRTAYPATVVSDDQFGGIERLQMVLDICAHWLAGMAVVGSVMMAAAVAAVTSSSTTLPTWLAWVSALAAVLQVVGLVIWPATAAVTLAWILVFAIVMRVR